MAKTSFFPPSLPACTRRTLLAVLLAAMLPACSSFSTPEPPVADSTLVEVLVELQLVSARSDLYRDVPPGTRDSVLVRHGLTKADFEAAMRYYSEHPETFVEIYTNVLDRINEERQGE